MEAIANAASPDSITGNGLSRVLAAFVEASGRVSGAFGLLGQRFWSLCQIVVQPVPPRRRGIRKRAPTLLVCSVYRQGWLTPKIGPA